IKDDVKSVRALLDAGGDSNYALPSGSKVLAVAASHRSLATANALVLAGADPNVADSAGNTPLHMAAQLGNSELAANLLKKGANPNAKTSPASGGQRRAVGQLTPLHAAASARHESVLRILAAHGADPLLDAQDNTTLLLFAAQSGSAGVVRYVYENLDPRIGAVSSTGRGVLNHAAMGTAGAKPEEICDAIRFLAAHGAKPAGKPMPQCSTN
ncbi:MAG: ankyrin repeat domain-containing protein, partial [Solimonas sp.]